MSLESTHIGQRRAKCWWEPTYNPSLQGKLAPCSWKFDDSTGPKQSYLSGEALTAQMPAGEVCKFVDLTFMDCDFQGIFQNEPSIYFDSCRFFGCDFAFSKWHRVTFRKCEFKGCSLALASFTECEFRDCSWTKIGLSGHKTDFSRTFITNPKNLIKAGFSGLDPNASDKRKHGAYQASRLEATKAHVARGLLESHENVGDDRTYYDTARLHDLQQVSARISESWFELRFGARSRGLQLFFLIFEWILLSIIGFSNSWGASLLRPLIALILTSAAFSFLYQHLLTAHSNPWQRAFDIGSLVGYGNAANELQPLLLRELEGLQLIICIFFYTIFFSTAVARFSRAR